MSIEPGILVVGAACVLLAGGFLAGRLTGQAHARIRDLTAELESSGKQREFAQAARDSALSEIAQIKEEHRKYREEVVEHFSGTSTLMRDLTLQYRAVYEHLTRGATGLCPEGSVSLQAGLASEQLGEGEPVDRDRPEARDSEV